MGLNGASEEPRPWSRANATGASRMAWSALPLLPAALPLMSADSNGSPSLGLRVPFCEWD